MIVQAILTLTQVIHTMIQAIPTLHMVTAIIKQNIIQTKKDFYGVYPNQLGTSAQMNS